MVFQGKPTNSSTKITIHEKTKVLKKSKSMPLQMTDPKRRANGGSSVAALKSRIKEMGPICKSRKKCEKDSPASKQAEKDDADFDWLFDKAVGQVNQEEFFWLSSESLSPFYNVGDFKLMSPREFSVSLVSSWVDCRLFRDNNPIKEGTSCEESWISLINLDGEDSKWINGNVGLDSENLESDFPSPTYKMNSVSEVDDVSGSLDLDQIHFDEPLMWPFGDWSSRFDFFVQSPRKGLGESSAFFNQVNKDGRKWNQSQSKELWKRRILVASGLSASKIVEFKRGNRRIAIANASQSGSKKGRILGIIAKKNKVAKHINLGVSNKRLRTMSLGGIDELKKTMHSCSSSMDFDAAGWSVSLINLNGEDCEWMSELESEMEEDFPSPSYKKKENQTHCLDQVSNWDQMEADDDDEPLFWPYGKDKKWTMTLDTFNVSPRKGLVSFQDSKKSTSIRVRIHGKKLGFKRSLIGVSVSKINGFKRARGNKGSARRVKGVMKSRFGRFSGAQKMDVVMEVEGEEGAVERMLGLSEFDGHEGIEMEFQTDNFSILEE